MSSDQIFFSGLPGLQGMKDTGRCSKQLTNLWFLKIIIFIIWSKQIHYVSTVQFENNKKNIKTHI